MKGEEKLRIIESSRGKKLHFTVNPSFHKYTQEVFLASNSQAVSHSHGSWNEVPDSWFLSASREAVVCMVTYGFFISASSLAPNPAFNLKNVFSGLSSAFLLSLPWSRPSPCPAWINSGSFCPDVWLLDSPHTGLFSVRLQNHPVQNNISDHILFPLKNSVIFLLSLR